MNKFQEMRVCQHCKNDMHIDADNICSVVRYRGKYYHRDCFVEYMQTRIAKEPKNADKLRSVLDNIDTLTKDAKNALMQVYSRDALNEYLLQHYTVVSFSGRFWQKIAELAKGRYNNRPSAVVGTDELLDMWKWAQKDLDNIYRYNKSIGNDMVGEDRVHYDFAVVIRKYGEYKRDKAQMKKNVAQYNTTSNDSLNINKMKNTQKKSTQDISDILGDIFGR